MPQLLNRRPHEQWTQQVYYVWKVTVHENSVNVLFTKVYNCTTRYRQLRYNEGLSNREDLMTFTSSPREQPHSRCLPPRSLSTDVASASEPTNTYTLTTAKQTERLSTIHRTDELYNLHYLHVHNIDIQAPSCCLLPTDLTFTKSATVSA